MKGWKEYPGRPDCSYAAKVEADRIANIKNPEIHWGTIDEREERENKMKCLCGSQIVKFLIGGEIVAENIDSAGLTGKDLVEKYNPETKYPYEVKCQKCPNKTLKYVPTAYSISKEKLHQVLEAQERADLKAKEAKEKK